MNKDIHSRLDSEDGKRTEKLTLSLPPSITEDTDASDKTHANEATPIPVSADKHTERPTTIEVFTGQAVGVVAQLFEARKTNDKIVTNLRQARSLATTLIGNLKERQDSQLNELKIHFDEPLFNKLKMDLADTYKQATTHVSNEITQNIEYLENLKTQIDSALQEYQWTPGQLWLYQWSLVFLLVITGIIEGIFVYLYVHWHGVYTSVFDIYDPANIDLLWRINFVGGPTTLSIAAEVLVWSSLGVWAQQAYINTIKMIRRQFRFADDGPKYMGIMMRNTSVAAIIVILLKLSKFSLFGVSLDAENPLAFDFTIGLSFLLGFFGDDATKILSGFRDRVVKGTSHKGG